LYTITVQHLQWPTLDEPALTQLCYCFADCGWSWN